MLKATGRLAALFLVTGVVGLVLFGVVRSKRGAVNPPAAAPAVRDFGAPPDVSNAGGSSGGGSPQDLIALADEGAWTRVDPATGRVRFKMTWKRLDPEARGEFRIERPRLWMIDGGRTIRLESLHANVVWPSRNDVPESGEMSGGVVLTAYDGEGTSDAAFGGVEMIGSVRTESMSFNQAARELQTPDTIRFQSAGIQASAVGMTLRLGADRSTPISFFRIERDGRIEFSAEERGRTAHAPRAGDQQPRASGSVENPFEFYEVTLDGGVSLDAGGRSMAAGVLTLFARTRDGRLRDGAIAAFESADRRDGRGERPTRKSDAGRANPAILTWNGALELRVLGEQPIELATDDLVARLSAAGGGVEMVDRETRSRLDAESIEYAATTRRIKAVGGAQGVEARIGDTARVRADQFELDLTTGEGAISGGGEAWLLDKDHRGARWTERAEFAFDAADGPIGSADSAVMKHLRLAGGVSVMDGEAALEADGLRVMFDRTEGDNGAPASTLTRLAASGSARAHDSRGGTVRGENIDVLFERDARGEPVPTIATIRENAVAERKDESLSADLIEAMLARSPDGDVQIASVEALDHVVGTIARDGSIITVNARTLRADALLETADLIGEPVTIERTSSNGTGMLSGPSMRLEAREGVQRLTIFGAGTSRYAGTGSDGVETSIEVDWTGGLIYTDAIGRAEVEGGANARLSSGADERHAARGERIVVDLTPAAEAAQRGGERELVRALIEGTDEAPAEIELRRYVAGTLAGGDGSLEGLAFLRGPSIEVSGVASRLHVEGPGVLLLEDRRPASLADGSNARGGPIEFNGTRGTTLFSWESAMTLDRATGLGEMSQNVIIRHKDAATSRIAEIACQRATMTLAESQPGSGSLDGITLTRAEATGGVTARYKALQISSAILIYEAAGRIIAAAEQNGSITIYDEESGRSVSGEAAIVDTATGTYRIEKLESIAMPR